MKTLIVHIGWARWCGCVAVVAAAAVALGEDAKVAAPVVGPAARLAVAVPATQPAVYPAPAVKRPWMPAMRIEAKPRKFAPGAVKAPVADAEKPALVAADVLPAPGRPQMVEGARRLVTPAAALAPRIPDLLVSPRKNAQGGSYAGQPAAPITTGPVNNLRGTSELPLLAPFTREIVVEIAPPAAPLAFDRAPYVQAPGVEDDEDAPATMGGEGVRVRVA